ncbi:glycosyltransferase [Mariniluteicoccus endophyticus]
MTTTNELWSWAHHEPDEKRVDVSGLRVTAVLVAHNAAAWLPSTLASLRALTVRPTRWIAVDGGSDDQTQQLLLESGLFDVLVEGDPAEGFGQSVAGALEAVDDHEPLLWMLHDDVVVEPDSLERLLAATVTDAEGDVFGPKLLQPGRGERRIAELGLSMADSGRLVTSLEPGEIDQGQHTPAQVLGVSACGMLVRRPVWDALGGLAPELPLFHDGLDFGWRATAAGHRVVTVPDAVITHRSAGRSGLRRSTLIGADPESYDRALALRTVAARRGGAGLVAGSYARALGFLLAKAPSRAAGELRAVKTWRNGPDSLRTRVPKPSPEVEQRLAALRPGRGAGLVSVADTVYDWAAQRWDEAFGTDPETTIDDLIGDDFSGSEAPRRRFWSRPVPLVGLLLTVLALVAGRGLFGLGQLTSEALLPARDSLAETWRAYLAPIPGAPGLSSPPWEGWVALLSTLTFGRPEWLVTGLALLCVPLAYASAQVLLRRVVEGTGTRVLAGTAYALLPFWLGALGRGALGLWLVAIALPLLAVGLRGIARRHPDAPERLRAAWWTGLAATLVISFHPVLLGAGLVGALAAAVAWRSDRTRLLRVAIAVGVPLVLLAPWWPAVARGGSRLLLGPDAGTAGPAWAGLPPTWLLLVVAVVAAVLALAGLARRTASTGVWVAWATGLLALTGVYLLHSRLATTLPFGTRVRPDEASLLLLAGAAFVLAAAIGLDRLTPRPLAVAAAVLAAAVLLGSAGWWVWQGSAGPLHRAKMDDMPPFVRVAMKSPAATRTLALRFDRGQLSWSLVADDQLRLGDADRGLAFGGSKVMQDRTRSVVARLVGGAGDEQVATDLRALGIAHVWVVGADEEQRTRITNVPGLGAGSGDERGLVWTVPGTTARLLVTGQTPVPLDGRPGASPAVDLPAGSGRTLTMADPADSRRVVTYAGQRLEPQSTGVQSVYAIPDGPGRLEVDWHTPVRPWLVGLQGLGLLAVAILAAPSLAGERRRRAASPATPARRTTGGAA